MIIEVLQPLVKLKLVLESIRDPMWNLLSSMEPLRNSIHQFNGDIQKLFTGSQNTPQHGSKGIRGKNILISNHLNTIGISFKEESLKLVNSLKISDNFNPQYSNSISNISKKSSIIYVSNVMSGVKESMQTHLDSLQVVFQNMFGGVVKSGGNVSTVFNNFPSQDNSRLNIPIKQTQDLTATSPFNHRKNMPANKIINTSNVVDIIPPVSNLSLSSLYNSLFYNPQKESDSMTDTKKLSYYIPPSKSNFSTVNKIQKEYLNASTSDNKQTTINIARLDINDGVINNVEDFILQLQRRI